jgi:hypothetical protein
MDAVVVHDWPFGSDPEAGARWRDRGVSFQLHSLSRLHDLAVQIHSQFLGTGVILQNELSLRWIQPPDVSFQTNGVTRLGGLCGVKPDLMDIGYLNRGRVIESLIGSYHLTGRYRTHYQSETTRNFPRPNQPSRAHKG